MGRLIGLLGGSFNPAHEGHLHVANTSLKRLGLTEVWFVVARGNPLKSDHGDYEARATSVRHLINGNSRLKLCEVEAEHDLTYTIDTVRTLQHLYRSDQFVWIMGSDSLSNFDRWRDWQQIAFSIPIAVIARPGSRPGKSVFERTFPHDRLAEHTARRLPHMKPPGWVYLKAPHHPQSSTSIRNRNT